jgi:predicted nucleic acid-binding protein
MALVDLALKGTLEVLISTALVLEYEAVLTRSEHLRVSELSLGEVEKMLDAICETATEIKVRWNWRPQLKDADDEMVLEAALNGRAEAIITFNRIHFVHAARRFGVAVLSPAEALGRIGIK